MVNLDRCIGSCNTLNNRICVPKKGDLNLRVFNLITEINKKKTFTNHILYKCKCELDRRKCN